MNGVHCHESLMRTFFSLLFQIWKFVMVVWYNLSTLKLLRSLISGEKKLYPCPWLGSGSRWFSVPHFILFKS